MAKLLGEHQEQVASELAEVEMEFAERVSDKGTGRACEILREGHLEAAAILLEARTRVEEDRVSP